MPRECETWVCECENEAFYSVVEETTSIGNAIFRKEPCSKCRLPMQLSSSFTRHEPPPTGGKKSRKPKKPKDDGDDLVAA